MSDYVITYTDPSKSEFIIKPWTTNGPTTPSSTSLPASAISANTSLNLLGKGKFEYGEIVQENLVRMLEHFAYSAAPSYPIEGQIWFNNTPSSNQLSLYDGSGWSAVFVSGKNTSTLDASGQKITNLANAETGTDALNLQTGDLRYVNITGDTLTGYLTLNDDPVNDYHAATKKFVVDTIAGTSGFVNATGDTMSGRLVIQNGGLEIQDDDFLLSGSSTFNAGGRPLLNIVTTNSTSAASRGYVDGVINTVKLASIVYNGTSDLMSFTTVTGSTISSNQIITNSVVDNNPTYDASYFRDQTYSDPLSIPQALSLLDSAASAATRRIKRYTLSDSTDLTISLPFRYHTETDRLQVFKNGYKLKRANRAVASVQFDPDVTCATPLNNSTGIYSYSMIVDGYNFDNVLVDLTTYPNTHGKQLASILNTELKQKGYQTISFATPLVDGSELTGYPADMFQADITVDGVTYNINFDCTSIITINDLIDAINGYISQLSCFILDGKLVIQSRSRGFNSTILIDDSAYVGSPENQLFTSLTNFTSIDLPVDGYDMGSTYGQQAVQFMGGLDDGNELTNFTSNNYEMSINVDGVTYSLSINDGSDYVTINDLIYFFNVQLDGAATCLIENGALVFRSNTIGINSTISITDSLGSPAGILSSLMNFVSIDAAVNGATGLTILFEDDKLLFMSTMTGPSSQVVVTTPTFGADLFSAFQQTTSISNQIIDVEPWDFYEPGTPLQTHYQFTLITPLIASDVIEVLLLPGWIL